MINLLLFLTLIACLGLTGAWVAEHPGSMTLYWFDWRVDTSAAFVLLVVLAAAAFLTLFALLVRRIILAPSAFGKQRSLRHYQRAVTELTYSVAALAASDIATAQAHTRKVEKLLGRSPLTLLLSAQISKNQGDDAKTQALLEQLLEFKETKYLAARSLSDAASKQDNLAKALEHARSAQRVNPKDAGAALAIISLQVRMGQWNDAQATLQKSPLARAQRNRLRATLQLAHGQSLLEHGHDVEALELARTVIHALPGFAPACAFAALAFAENHHIRKAVRVLRRGWAHSRHPLLLQALEDVAAHEAPTRQEKIRTLLTGHAEHGHWHCTACEHTPADWALHCNDCGSFDTLAWK